MRLTFIRQIMLAVVAVFAFAHANATSVLQMNLATMAKGSDKVFAGVVIDIQQRYIQAGGGTIPAVDYKVLVSDEIKGNLDAAEAAKEGGKVVTISMLGVLDATARKTKKVIPSLPVLELGSEYLLMMSPESSIGLSATIGLNQGCFKVLTNEKTNSKSLLNQADNVGLFSGMSLQSSMPAKGPVSYQQVVNFIKNQPATL